MKKINNSKEFQYPSSKNIFLFFGGLIAVILLLYWKPITTASLLNFDDSNLLLPISAINSFSEYKQLKADNIILDLQPIRDFSYFLEFKASQFFGIPIFPQGVNLILWILTLLFVYQILQLEKFTQIQSTFVISLIALHPAAVNALAWASGRKHVLSLLFIVAATYCLLQWIVNNKKRFFYFAIVFYALSCLSQPINVAWFLWAIFILYKRKNDNEFLKSSILFGVTLACVGLIVIVLNLFYYASDRYLDFQGEKFISEGSDFLGNRILIFGRFFFQLLIPIQPSITSYDPRASSALIGFFLLIIYLIFLSKIKDEKQSILIWGLFTLLPLLVSNGLSNQHFGWDTYLLTSIVGWTILNAYVVKSLLTRKFISEKKFSYLLIVVLILFSIQTKSAANAWENDETLWSYSLEKERTQASLVGYIKTNLSLKKNIHEMWSLANELQDKYPNHPEIGYIVGRMILEDNQISFEKKRELFENQKQRNSWFEYYYSAFEATQRNYSEADNRMYALFKNRNRRTTLTFGDKISEVLASWYAMCRFAEKSDCKEKMDTIILQIPKSRFSEKQFIERLTSYQLTFE